MLAVVMAGGKGERLRPLTGTRPKPMLPVANKPILQHILELLQANGINESLVTLHYLPGIVQGYFLNGSKLGLSIDYSTEEQPMGTAGGVKRLEDHLSERFMVLSGDVLTDINLSEVVAFHRKTGALATITLTRVQNPTEFGVVLTDADGKVVRFLEKPGWGEVFSDTVNAGIYVLEPEALSYVPTSQPFDFSKDLFPALLARGESVYALAPGGYWCDIGSFQQYVQANQDALNGVVKLSILGRQVAPKVWVGEGTELHRSAEVKGPSVIGSGCRIMEDVRIGELSVIGANVRLERGVSVERSIIWDNAVIGLSSELMGCVICERCSAKGQVRVLEGAAMGDDCQLGQGSTVQAGIKVWPGKVIEAGATLNMDLRWGIRWMRNLFGTHGITGLANVEITPEFASKLGAAFGSCLKTGSKVLVGRDTHRVSRMIKRALIAGLTSAGVEVVNLRMAPAPIVRYLIGGLDLDGGLSVKVPQIDQRSVNIEFFDQRGMDIAPSVEKEVERRFFREDLRRVYMDEVGDITYPSRALELYREGFMRHVDRGAIQSRGLKVVLDCANGAGSLAAPTLLAEAGCEVVTLNARIDELVGPRDFEEMPRSLAALANIVKALDADLGIALDGDADRAIFVDERGGVVSGDLALALMAMTAVKNREGGKVVLPVSASSAVEKVVGALGGSVLRARVGAHSLQSTVLREQAVFGGEETGSFIFPEFQPGFDGLFGSVKAAEMLARADRPMSSIVGEIPSFYLVRKEVTCPWHHQGKVFRSIIEDMRESQVDTLDGVKLIEDDSWVLFLPNAEKPVVNLFAEAPTLEQAQKLVAQYETKIQALISSEFIAA